MNIDTDAIMSVTEAGQNFSGAMRQADAKGEVVLFMNDRPKYQLPDLDGSSYFDMTDDEKIDVIAARILKKYRPAFEELAK